MEPLCNGNECPFVNYRLTYDIFEERYCRREAWGADLEVSYCAGELAAIPSVDWWAFSPINFQYHPSINFFQSIDGLLYAPFVPGSTTALEIPHCSLGILPATIKFLILVLGE